MDEDAQGDVEEKEWLRFARVEMLVLARWWCGNSLKLRLHQLSPGSIHSI